MTNDTKANWQVIGIETLPTAIRNAYDSYKEAYKLMKAERDAFEAALRSAVPAPVGKRLAIAYNFGKLSVAVVDDTTKPATAKGSVSLADLIRR